MRVVIVGLGKSGTTALFHAVAQAMPPDTLRAFEPERPPEAVERPLLVKVLATPALDWAGYRDFDRRVFIVRDPRDRLLSFLLYAIYNHPRPLSDAEMAPLLGLLRHKEAAPQAVGLWEISEAIERLMERDHRSLLAARFEAARAMLALDPGLHRVRYEQFVDGELDALERYLELPLGGPVHVPGASNRVARSRGYGDWRSWFTPADVAYFRPWLAPMMETFDYPDVWSLPASPTIDPAHGSRYVLGLLERQRSDKRRAPRWKRALRRGRRALGKLIR